LQEKDDRGEDEDFTKNRIAEDLLEDLVGHADAERAEDGAEEAADAADNNRHKGVNDVALAEAWADVTDLA